MFRPPMRPYPLCPAASRHWIVFEGVVNPADMMQVEVFTNQELSVRVTWGVILKGSAKSAVVNRAWIRRHVYNSNDKLSRFRFNFKKQRFGKAHILYERELKFPIDSQKNLTTTDAVIRRVMSVEAADGKFLQPKVSIVYFGFKPSFGEHKNI